MCFFYFCTESIFNLLILPGPCARIHNTSINIFICVNRLLFTLDPINGLPSHSKCSIAFLLFAFYSQRNSICRCENEIGDCNFHTECHHFVYKYIYVWRLCVLRVAFAKHPPTVPMATILYQMAKHNIWTIRNNNITKCETVHANTHACTQNDAWSVIDVSETVHNIQNCSGWIKSRKPVHHNQRKFIKSCDNKSNVIRERSLPLKIHFSDLIVN